MTSCMYFSYEKSHGGGEKGVVDEKVRKIDKISRPVGTGGKEIKYIYLSKCYRLLGKGKVGRMTSHACSRYEDKEIHMLAKIDEAGRNMREGEEEGKRDKRMAGTVGHREGTKKVGEKKEPTKMVKRRNQRSW